MVLNFHLNNLFLKKMLSKPLKFLRKQTSHLSDLIEPKKQSNYSFLGISYKINRDTDGIKSIVLYDKMGKSYFIPKYKGRDLKLNLKLDRTGGLVIQDLNSSFLDTKSGSSSPQSGITLTANNSGIKFSSSIDDNANDFSDIINPIKW